MSNPISVVRICNQALSRIGSSQIITSLSDDTDAAVQCNVWYEQTRDALLRDFPWPWAQAFSVLNQVSVTGQRANGQWLISYRYPTDALTIRKIATTIPAVISTPPPTPVTSLVTAPDYWLREDGDPLPVPYSIGHDVDGRLIFADYPNLTAWFTQAVTDPVQFSPDFASLLSWRLATEISYSLAVSDKRREYAQKMYESELAKTRAMALNEMQSDIPRIIMQSEVARARFGG